MTVARVLPSVPKIVALAACATLMSGCASGDPDPLGPTVVLNGEPGIDDPGIYLTIEPSPDGPAIVEREGNEVVPDIYMASINESTSELWVVVYVPGINEGGGTCAVTLTAADTSQTQVHEGFADVSHTACGLFAFPLADVPSGTAQVIAEYESATYAGVSPPAEVDIP